MTNSHTTNARIVYPIHERTGFCGPLPYQKEMHESRAEVKLLQWGVGTGKTQWGSVEAESNMVRFAGKYGLIVAPTYRMLKDATIPKITATLEAFKRVNGFSLVDHFHKSDMVMTVLGGGEVRLRSSDDPDKIRGPDYAWAWFDEASMMMNQDMIWDITTSRMRAVADPRIWITTTPRGNDGMLRHVHEQIAAGNKKYVYSQVPTFSNILLPAGYCARMKDEYSDDFYRQEVLAEVVDGSGTVFGRMFGRTTHMVEFDISRELRRKSEAWDLFVSIDWGDVYNHAVYIAHHRESDVDFVFGERLLDHATVDQFRELVVEDIRKFPKQPKTIFTDPTGNQYNAKLRTMLGRKVPVHYEWRTNVRDIAFGVELCKRRLQSASGKKRMLFSADLLRSPNNRGNGRGIILSLENYKYQSSRDGFSYRDKFADNSWHNHAIDAWRYYVINRYQDSPGRERLVV